MTESLFSIAYISRSYIVADALGGRQEIQRILDASQRNNRRDGVTGALLFTRSYFTQVLEGPIDAVEETFERVQLDRRHVDVRTIFHRPIVDRAFGEWRMAFAGLHDDDIVGDVVGVFRNVGGLATRPDGDPIVTLMQELVCKHEALNAPAQAA